MTCIFTTNGELKSLKKTKEIAVIEDVEAFRQTSFRRNRNGCNPQYQHGILVCPKELKHCPG
jgi:hypothetical protein